MKKQEEPKKPEQVLVNKDSLEAIAYNIQKISAALRDSFGNQGQLNTDALVTLLHRQCGGIARGDIHRVLTEIRTLDKAFVVGGVLNI